MTRFLLLCAFHIAQYTCSNKLYGQQEILPLPLDQLNRDSLNKIIEQKEKERDRKSLTMIYGGMYNFYLYSSCRDSAVKYAMKAEENAYQAGDSAKYYFIQLQLAEFYTGFDFEIAQTRYEKSLAYYLRTKNYGSQANCLGGLSYMYELKKDTVNQIKYLDLGEAASIRAKDSFNIMGANYKRAKILMKQNNFDSAINLLRKNIWIIGHSEAFGNSEKIRSFWRGWHLNMLADCYYRVSEYKLAILYLREALQYDKQTADFDAQNIFRYRFLINSYVKTGQKDSAVKYVDAFYDQTIKTLENLNPGKLKEISTKYETEKKQREIVELQQKNHLQQLTVSNQRKLNVAAISIFFITLISVYLIIKNIREKRKIAVELTGQEMIYKEQLHKQKELEIRNRISRDLHDDIGSALSSIKAYSEILKNDPDNALITGLIKDNATEMIEQLEVIAWTTNPQHDNFKSLQDTMLKFARPFCHSRNIDFNFEKDGIDEQLMIPGDVRQNIFLVFKESINNMIKYADAKECVVSMFIKNQKFVLQVKDNGNGSDGVIHGSGSGLKNINKRAEELNGKIEIVTMPAEGTIVKLSIPYPF